MTAYEAKLQTLVRVLTWMAIAMLAVVLVRTAWLSDDAYISFRTIRNFLAGDGLRWNLAERVQVFTHPLWLFLLSSFAAITGELYYTTFAVSFACTFAAVALIVFRVAPTRTAGLACAIALVGSRSFIDFSTSGLENPLTHLLLALFAWRYIATTEWSPRRLFQLALIGAFATTTRFDLVVLVAPVLAWAWWQVRSVRAALAIVAGFAPLFAWELFSIIYYGFPFPNTAYAKLPAAIGIGSRLFNGGRYLVSCAIFDPLAMTAIAVAIVAPFVRRAKALAPLSVAIFLYGVYVVWVGGDFMAGRFFTAPLVLAMAEIAHVFSWPMRRRWLAPCGAALVASLALGVHSPLLSAEDYGTRWHWTKNIDGRRVADERAVYHKITGLVRAQGAFRAPWHAWFEFGARMPPGGASASATVGFTGWAAPRNTYIIDQLGLGDAFIARLPPIKTTDWRPGHLDRAIPAGYVETRTTGHNRLRNRGLAEYYDQLALVTGGPLWSGERWVAIWRLNTGGLDHLLERYADIDVSEAELAAPRPDGAPARVQKTRAPLARVR